MVEEIFRLNPPVLNVFDEDNAQRWSPLNGVSVLIINWAVFFGNAIALTLFAIFQRGATTAEFNLVELTLVFVTTVAAVAYGARTIFPPLRRILSRLHDMRFRIGWPRKASGLALMLAVVALQHFDQIVDPADQANDLLGPAFANAVDGETLFMRGVEVKLFGIDAVERDQQCQDAMGLDYPCGRRATQALQRHVQNHDVVCWRAYAISSLKVLGICALQQPGVTTPETLNGFMKLYRSETLSRLQVEQGHALSVGVGEERFGAEQDQAQTLRLGIWQGSFEPPANWRARH